MDGLIYSDTIICVVTLEPYTTVSGTVRLDLPTLGMDWQDRFLAAVPDTPVPDRRFLGRRASH